MIGAMLLIVQSAWKQLWCTFLSVLKEPLEATIEDGPQLVGHRDCQVKHPFSLSHLLKMSQLTMSYSWTIQRADIPLKHLQEVRQAKLVDYGRSSRLQILQLPQHLEVSLIEPFGVLSSPTGEDGHGWGHHSLCHTL